MSQLEARFPGLDRSEATVTALYLGMLARDPDSEGFAFWVDKFERGTPRQDLIMIFIDTVEYYSRFLD
ncbi:MAG: DUF4214 domain-containing protein [Candidatus Competibacterales bacterium]